MHTPYTKVLADGRRVPGADPRTDHVALIDHAAQLMICVESIGAHNGPGPADAVIEACRHLHLAGYTDWRAATRREALLLIDDTRRNPALDPSLFPRIQTFPHWTATPLMQADQTPSAAISWRIGIATGDAGYYERDRHGFALAVRDCSP